MSIQLMLGECLERMQEIETGSVDMVMTSPPYDNLRTYNDSLNDWCAEKWKAIQLELTRILSPGGVIVWVVADGTSKGSETLTSMRQAIHFKDVCGLNVHDTMIYASDKPPLTHNRYEQCWEYMFVFSKGKPKTWNPLKRKADNPGGKSGKFIQRRDGDFESAHTEKRTGEYVLERNIWCYATGHERNGHPAVYPLSLAQDHIMSWSNEGDLVVDPFLGSGTTGVACINTGRNFIGIERDPEYFKIAQDRCDPLAGIW